MKKAILPVLIVATSLQLNSQNTIPSTTVTGDLKVQGSFNLFENYKISYSASTESSPPIVSFLPVTGSKGGQGSFKQPCNILYPAIDPNQPASYQFLQANAFSDLIQVYGKTNSNSALSIGVTYDDGIIALEPLPYTSALGKLRINPGCLSDVEICEGGGYTKVFGDAGILGFTKIGKGTFNYPQAAVAVNLNTGATKALNIANPALSGSNKTIFDVGTNGQTTIGNQSGANNSAFVNINVAGGNIATDVFDVFDQYSNLVNFRIKSNGFVYSREVNVQINTFPDYVFNADYQLQNLESLETYIKTNHHLPNVPSATEVAANGANLGELSKIQMEKIEELTLYIIELKKEMEALKLKVEGK